MSELEKLREQHDAILKRCKMYKGCKDGSYEMALHNNGYYNLRDQIELLERQLNAEKT